MDIFMLLYYVGGIVKLDREDVRQVLAMFDKEDIPYINFAYLFNNCKKRYVSPKVRIRKLGGCDGKSRK